MDAKTFFVVVGIAIAMVAFIVFLTDNPVWQQGHRADLEALRTATDDANAAKHVARPRPIAPSNSQPPAAVAADQAAGKATEAPPPTNNTTENSPRTSPPPVALARVDAAASAAIPSAKDESPAKAGDAKADAARTKTDGFRNWTASTGLQVEAQYVSHDNVNVVLKCTDGKLRTIQLSALSPTDIEYLKNLPAAEPEKVSLEREIKPRDRSFMARVPALPRRVTPSTVEQVAKGRRSAKDALKVYESFLADDSISEELKEAAKSRLPYWQALAEKDSVRFGTRWMSADEAEVVQNEAAKLVADAFTLLKADKDPEARKKLEKARITDPESTDALYVLGLLAALKDRNYPKAKPYFAECIRRDPLDVGAMNNLAALNALTNDHPESIANFKAALAIDPEFPEAKHNLRRTLDLSGAKALATSAANITVYKVIYDAAGRDPASLDRIGWLYVVPPDLLASIAQLQQAPGVIVYPQRIEDRACMMCRGVTKVPCPECHGRGIVTATGKQRVGTNLSGAPATVTVKAPADCAKCAGSGFLHCPMCPNGIDRTLQ